MSARLDLLKPILSLYKRRFTVLDLGAGVNDPTLGREISQAFDAVVVEVEQNWLPAPTGPRTIVLRHAFTIDELERLSRCEHFDVVLAFNIIHWFGTRWREAAQAVLGMGDYVFTQIPCEADMDSEGFKDAWPESWTEVPAMLRYFRNGCAHLGDTAQFPGHPPRPVYLTKNKVKHLTATTLNPPYNDADIAVLSTHKGIQGSFLHKKPREHREWIPGINLWNFCQLGGAVPAREKVLEMLNAIPLPEKQHGDIQPWNMILDGERLHLIDEAPGKVDLSFASDADQLNDAVKRVREELTRLL